MSGLAQIRRHTWHNINSACCNRTGVGVQELQAFAGGYVSLPDQALDNLTNFIWHGKRRYDAATDTLIDIPTVF